MKETPFGEILQAAPWVPRAEYKDAAPQQEERYKKARQGQVTLGGEQSRFQVTRGAGRSRGSAEVPTLTTRVIPEYLEF